VCASRCPFQSNLRQHPHPDTPPHVTSPHPTNPTAAPSTQLRPAVHNTTRNSSCSYQDAQERRPSGFSARPHDTDVVAAWHLRPPQVTARQPAGRDGMRRQCPGAGRRIKDGEALVLLRLFFLGYSTALSTIFQPSSFLHFFSSITLLCRRATFRINT